MSTPAAAVFGTQTPQVEGADYNELQFVIMQTLLKVQTLALCRVQGCTNAGGVVPAGTVDVLPLVNQMTGNRISVPHGTIYRLPYARMQGGANAIIIDPTPGDICLVGFCSRDISSVVAAKGPANPGSFRTFNWADGIYISAVCNGIPSQYIAFAAGGISIVSPTQVSIQAPVIAIGSGAGTATSIDGIPFLPHNHISEAPSTPTGPALP